MAKIYKNQTQLTITLAIGSDISNVSTAKIKYIKPDDTTGEFTAAIDAPNRKISYVVQSASDIDQSGKWIFWAYLTYASGNIIVGEPDSYIVFEEGK